MNAKKTGIPTRMRAHVYAPLWKCMYCFSVATVLSAEHVIPESLNGSLVLPRAVCEPCRELTGKYEQRVLNSDLLVPRVLLELRRKRAKTKQPKKLPPIAIGPGLDHKATIPPSLHLSAEEQPEVFWVMKLPPAGLISGADRGGKLAPTDELVLIHFPMPNPKRSLVAQRANRHGWQISTEVYAIEFALSVAKWAYAYAVAERGIDCADTSQIRDLLRHKRHDYFNFFGGRFVRERDQIGQLHRMEIRERGNWLTVVVHLFAPLSVPPYEVVIGELTRT